MRYLIEALTLTCFVFKTSARHKSVTTISQNMKSISDYVENKHGDIFNLFSSNFMEEYNFSESIYLSGVI